MNFEAFIPCLRGLSNRCHDYKNLHTLVKLSFVLNADICFCIMYYVALIYHVFQITVTVEH